MHASTPKCEKYWTIETLNIAKRLRAAHGPLIVAIEVSFHGANTPRAKSPTKLESETPDTGHPPTL